MSLADPPATARKNDALAAPLKDGFGRRFEYLRLSLTEMCNFRCNYCLPHGFRKQAGLPAELQVDEMRRAVTAFAQLGLWKVRLTGGEPSVRPDFAAIAQQIAAIPGISQLAMSTNGYRLAAMAQSWRDAGVQRVNISIDSLDPNIFARITGHDRLDEVIAGVDAALAARFEAVKINSVLMRDLIQNGGLSDWDAVMDFIRHRVVSWRFIEVMRTNDNAAFHADQATLGDAMRARLLQEGWIAVPRSAGAGPAVEYAHPDYLGRIGLIAPYAAGFCDSCNRLRLSSRGRLQVCLFGEEGADLRPLLQHDDQREELVHAIKHALLLKPRAHRLHEGQSGATPHLASIGG